MEDPQTEYAHTHGIRNKVKLTDDEKRAFDNISYDEIAECKDLGKLYKLEQYMRAEGFPQTADVAKLKILELGGRNPDQDDPSRRAEAEAALQDFRESMAEWETEMHQTEKLILEERTGRGGSTSNNRGRPPIRQVVVHGNKENKMVENKPLSEEQAKKFKDCQDVRSGRNYYDKWSKYTEEQLAAMDEEERTEAALAEKKLKGEIEPTDEEREAEKIDDGGSGLKDVYRAMASMTPAERKWQGAREKEKGNECFKSKEYTNAINAYSLALKLNPGVAATHTNRAAAYLKVKRYEDAAQDCTWALELDPGNFKALLRRGAARLEMEEEGSIELAVQDIEAALEQEPQNKELKGLHEKALRLVRNYIDKKESARMNRVMIEEVDDSEEEDDGDESDADDELEVSVAVGGGHVETSESPIDEYASEEELEGEEEVDEDEAPDLPTQAEAEKKKGNEKFAAGDYAGAERCYTASLELLPGNVPVLSNRAKCYLKLNKFAKAEDDADVVLLIDPEFVKAYHSRGIAKANLGLKTEALQDLRKVLKVAPESDVVRKEVAALQTELYAAAYIPARPPGAAMIVEIDSDEDEEDVERKDLKNDAEREQRLKVVAAEAMGRKKNILDEVERAKKAKAAKRNNKAALQAARTKSRALLREKQAAAVPELAGAAAIPAAFVAATTFEGARPGYAFKLSNKGQGYYVDPPSGSPSTVTAAAVPTAPAKAPVVPAKAPTTPTEAPANTATQAATLKDAGNQLFKSGNHQEAMQLYTQSLALERNAGVLTNRAAAHHALGDHAAAEADATAAIRLDVSHVKAYHRRAQARAALKKLPEALSDFQVVARALPNNAAVKAEVAALQVQLAPAGAETAAETAERRKDEGNALFRQGKYAEAVAKYGASVAAAATAAALANRAAAHLKLAEHAAAEADCNATLALEPGHTKALHRRAQARLAIGKLAESVSDFEAVAAALPHNAAVRKELVEATAARDKQLEANWEKVGEPEPPAAATSALSKVVVIEQNSGSDEDDDTAATALPASAAPTPVKKRIMIEEDSDSDGDAAPASLVPAAAPPPIPARKRIMIEEADSDSESEAPPASAAAAEPARTRVAIEEGSDSDEEEPAPVSGASALKDAGNAHFKSGDMRRAVEAYDQSLALEPGNALVLCNRSAAHLKLGQAEAAERDAEEAMQVNGAHIKAFHRRALARFALGKLKGALQDFNTVQRALPGNTQVAEELAKVKVAIAAESAAPAAEAAPATTADLSPKAPKADLDAKAAQAAAVSAEKYLERMPVPKSGMEFERACKALGDKPQVLARFVLDIPLDDYPRVFKDSINGNMLKSFVQCLREGIVLEATPEAHTRALGVLRALSTVSRFGMAIMLIPRAEKTALKAIFGTLEAAGHDCAALRKEYKL